MVSIIIPTLNSARTLEACLVAIRQQEFPRDQVEIVIADAGSSDDTLAIARRHNVERIVFNPLRTGEAGKAAGIAASSGDLLALVDSDNILPDPGWLQHMTAPFADHEIMGTEPLAYTCRAEDTALTRYFALLGMNDPICLFLGNYDRFCGVTGKWTALPVQQEDCGNHLKLTLTEAALPTIGANGFVFRRKLLEHVTWSPYFFDIDVVHQAVAAGLPHFAKVKTGIVHLFCDHLSLFRRKQQRRIHDFLYFAATRQRTYPWQRQNKLAIVRFALCTAFVLPLLVQMIRGMRRCPDRAWWYHVPVCWITLWVYGLATLGRLLGRKQKALDRDKWQVKAKQ
ncbi:MAG: glycosyltransferase family 2 protein [Magnetococcus sp. WYHC-3]